MSIADKIAAARNANHLHATFDFTLLQRRPSYLEAFFTMLEERLGFPVDCLFCAGPSKIWRLSTTRVKPSEHNDFSWEWESLAGTTSTVDTVNLHITKPLGPPNQGLLINVRGKKGLNSREWWKIPLLRELRLQKEAACPTNV